MAAIFLGVIVAIFLFLLIFYKVLGIYRQKRGSHNENSSRMKQKNTNEHSIVLQPSIHNPVEFMNYSIVENSERGRVSTISEKTAISPPSIAIHPLYRNTESYRNRLPVDLTGSPWDNQESKPQLQFAHLVPLPLFQRQELP